MKKFLSLILVVSFLIMLLTPSTKISAATTFNYGEALQKAIMFYEFQRSGKLPSPSGTTGERIPVWTTARCGA